MKDILIKIATEILKFCANCLNCIAEYLKRRRIAAEATNKGEKTKWMI